MNQFLPALPLAGLRVVVVGAGDAAENKLRLFRTSPAELVWRCLDRRAPPPRDLNPEAQIIAGDRVPLGAFRRARLVFIAVEDERRAARLARRARRAGALVNVVDRPHLSDFHTPALVDRGALTIALASGGAAPVLVRDLRAAIEGVAPKGAGRLAEAANTVQDEVRAQITEASERRRFWERALRGPAAIAADRGDVEGAKRLIRQDLAAGEAARPGVVHLVGAGPGDPELLTVKAQRLIRDADVIVHDRLVSPEVMDRARRDALRIDVGKTKGSHPVKQEAIAEILIEHARAGRMVVRLKGGDSFIFGRGGEEIEALRAAGIDAHVTPGISAALAAGASAQIPLTHRDLAQAVTFVTGQAKLDGPDAEFAALAAPNHTLALYMGVATAERFTARLIAAGRDASTPVAIVERASLPDERRITGRLAELPTLIRRETVTGPALIVIGEVAALALPQALELLEAAEAA